MLLRVVLDVEIERDQRPVALVAFLQSFLDDWLHLGEKLIHNEKAAAADSPTLES
jgi:hypothetical protein